MPRLVREGDGEGFIGSRVEAIKWNEDRTVKEIVGSYPIVGCSLLVGSLTAGTYSTRDYWLTTEVTEILEEKKDEEGKLEYVKFSTGNSIYEIFA